MPVRDAEVVLGKYLGVLGMYTVSLGFSLANVVVLHRLGDPDSGLMLSTYLGYWLMGALLCSVGLLASMFTANATVAFILGALGCAGLVVADAYPWASGILGTVLVGLTSALIWVVVRGESRGAAAAGIIGGIGATLLWLRDLLPVDETREAGDANAFVELFSRLGLERHFASFGEGVLQLGDVLYFVGGTAVLLYLTSFMLGRRTW
jgi:ABC-2 type transport system permease protein